MTSDNICGSYVVGAAGVISVCLSVPIAFLHEGFGFFEGDMVGDEYFKVAGSPVAYPADVAGEAGFKGVVVGVEGEGDL